jgi:hypothetical protein
MACFTKATAGFPTCNSGAAVATRIAHFAVSMPGFFAAGAVAQCNHGEQLE